MSEEIKDKIFDTLMKKFNVEELLCWNEFTLEDKLPKQAFLEVQWREKFISANKKLEELEERKKEIIADIFIEVRHPGILDKTNENKFARVGAGIDKKEFENYVIPADARIKEINKQIRFQKILVDFYDAVYEAIKRNTWNMKNWIDVHKRV